MTTKPRSSPDIHAVPASRETSDLVKAHGDNLLELLADGCAKLPDIAARLGIPEWTAHRILRHYKAQGVVVTDRGYWMLNDERHPWWSK